MKFTREQWDRFVAEHPFIVVFALFDLAAVAALAVHVPLVNFVTVVATGFVMFVTILVVGLLIIMVTMRD